MQGRTQVEAAEALGWPLGTVQIRLHRGRDRLRSRLMRRGVGAMGLAGADLAASLSARAAVPGREWTEATATAAVRFAGGKGTAGLISPAVNRLAESTLAAMLHGTLRVVALAVISLILISAALSWFVTSTREVGVVEGKNAEPRTATDQPVEPRPARGRRSPEKPRRPRPRRPGPKSRRPEAGKEWRDGHPGKTRSTMAACSWGRPHSRPIPATWPCSIVGPGRRRRRGASCSRGSGRRMTRGATEGMASGRCSTASSCVACHQLGGPGGAGGIDRNIEIATPMEQSAGGAGYSYAFSMDYGTGRFDYRMGNAPGTSSRPGMWFSMDYGAGRFDYGMGNAPGNSSRPRSQLDPRLLAAIHPGFRDSRSVVLHHYGTDPAYNAWRGTVPGQHGSILVRTSERNPPALFGAGLIDAIPDEAIEAAAKRKFPGSSAVKGRVSRLKDGRIGRFGWKAQTATLKEFVLSAAAGEMGLEVPGRRPGGRPPPPRNPREGAGHGRGGMRRPDRLRAKPSQPDRHPAGRRPGVGAAQVR